MQKKTLYKNPSDYIASLTEPERSDIIRLDKLIRSIAPSLKPYMESGMLGYGKYHYKSKSGREGDWAKIALARQKNYLSLYICVIKNGQYLPEQYKTRLGKVSIGKSCIRFKSLKDVDEEGLKALLIETSQLKGMASQ